MFTLQLFGKERYNYLVKKIGKYSKTHQNIYYDVNAFTIEDILKIHYLAYSQLSLMEKLNLLRVFDQKEEKCAFQTENRELKSVVLSDTG